MMKSSLSSSHHNEQQRSSPNHHDKMITNQQHQVPTIATRTNNIFNMEQDNGGDQLPTNPTQQTMKLPNISSFNYFHQEYATPLTSEFRSICSESTPQYFRSEPTTTSSTDSSSNNSSSQSFQSANTDKALKRTSVELCNNISCSSWTNEDSWHSNSCNQLVEQDHNTSAPSKFSSFDSSFQQALVDQTNEANRSKKLDVLTADEMRQYFCYTQQDAARLLGVSVSTLKRRFYELKLGKRWPYKRTKQTPRKRKDTHGKMSEERQLIDQGIRACSNVMILTPMSLKHSVSLGNTTANNLGSAVGATNATSGVGVLSTMTMEVSSNGKTSNREQVSSIVDQKQNFKGDIMVLDQNIKKMSSPMTNGIEKQHKMITKQPFSPNRQPFRTSPILFIEDRTSVNRSRSSSNLSINSNTNNLPNYSTAGYSNCPHHHDHERMYTSSSLATTTRNENSCKRENSMEQSRKKLSLSYIMNHSDTNPISSAGDQQRSRDQIS